MEQNPFAAIEKLKRDLERVERTLNGSVVPASLGDAKGDLIGFSAADTPVRIPAAASNGSVITSDTTQTGGVKWASSLQLLNVHGYIGDAAGVGMVPHADTASNRTWTSAGATNQWHSPGLFSIAQLDSLAGTTAWTLTAVFFGTNGGTAKTYNVGFAGYNFTGSGSLMSGAGIGKVAQGSKAAYDKWSAAPITVTRATLVAAAKSIYGTEIDTGTTEVANVSAVGVVLTLKW